ncbi:MAG: DUF6575 domain-containing protein [Pseudomonadota bacterium]
MDIEDKEFLTTDFGHLSVVNVYAYYEGPRAFSAKNQYGQMFFCYWLETKEDKECWLINPVSEALLGKLEQKKLPIAKLIKPSGYKSLHVVEENFDSGVVNTISISASSKLPFTLPSDKVFITENINVDGSRRHTHRIRLSKESTSLYLSNKVAEIFGAFSDLYKTIRQLHDVESKLETVDAVPGSFNFRVKASNLECVRERVYPTFKAASNKEGLLKLIHSGQIDLLSLRKTFDLLSKYNTDVELIEEDSTSVVLTLSSAIVEELIPVLDERLTTYLNSTMVPQADDLASIHAFISLVDRDGFVSSGSFGKTPRQVSYYRDAARILGLMHSYGKLTPKGIKALKFNMTEFTQLVCKQFEETECGYIWMNSSGVNNVLELNENSAGDFLIEYCQGLSENTARRRGSTLKRWVQQFKQHLG